MAYTSSIWSRADSRLTTDALYQEWCTWLSTDLTARGWTKTADTGQINTATVTHPAATYAELGYEIRTSPTSSHTTFYIKFWYRSGYNANIPQVSIQVGTGSDGAGTLTGVVDTVKPPLTNGWAAGNTNPYGMNMIVSGDEDSLWIHAISAQTAANSGYVGLERTTDSDGVSTDEGVLTASCHYNVTPRWQCLLWTGVAAQQTVTSTLRLTRAIYGGNTAVILPVFVQDGGTLMRQFRDMCISFTSSGVSFDATVKGATRTYRAGLFHTSSTMFGYTMPDSVAMCIREDWS